MAAEVSRLDPFIFLLVALREVFCIFRGDNITVSQAGKDKESHRRYHYSYIRKGVENMHARISHVVRVNGGHNEQDIIRIKLLEYIYYDAYRNRRMT